MHDVLRQRLIRKIESLPDTQIYQILDYIEFLESKYATAEAVEASGLQKFAEGLEDKLRKKAVSPSTIREAFQLISAADRVLSGVAGAGRKVMDDLGSVLEPDPELQAAAEREAVARAEAAQAAADRAESGHPPEEASRPAQDPPGASSPNPDSGEGEAP